MVFAETGDLVFKPRDQWHTFWNPGDEPVRILEVISPAGFERYFEEIVDLTAEGTMDPAKFPKLAAPYGLEGDLESIPRLCEEHGLVFGPPEQG